MAGPRAAPLRKCCICDTSVEGEDLIGCLALADGRSCGRLFCTSCARPVCPSHLAAQPGDLVLLFSDGASHRELGRSGGAFQLVDGGGNVLKRGGASFDFWATPAQSEYVTLLAGCQAWAQILASQGRGDNPTTLWAFADNMTVVNLAHESSQQSERSPSTTADLKTWGHLVPLHEAAEIIFGQLRQMRCDASVRWLSRESAPIKKVDYEAKKNTYKSRRAKKVEHSLFFAFSVAIKMLESAAKEQQDLWWQC